MPTADEQVVVDGQRALAVSEVSGDFIYEGGATDAYCIVNNNGTAQRALKVANVGEGGGGGGGGTVDQTYDPTSTNAQSGTAVAEAVQPALKNTATGTEALTILGTSANTAGSVNLGYYSNAKKNGTAVGFISKANAEESVALGHFASASSTFSIALGFSANVQANCNNSIQLGRGTNSTANSFQVYSYQMLDGTTGLIPAARIGTGYDATKTQVLKNVNGTLTWVDE